MTIAHGATASAIDRATAVMAAHDRACNAGDVDGIMEHIAEDVVVMVPDVHLIEGRNAAREFYTGRLRGKWAGTGDVAHYFASAEETGDVVVLHGVASGAMRPPGNAPIPVANNFVVVLKADVTGEYRIWRLAFAPTER